MTSSKLQRAGQHRTGSRSLLALAVAAALAGTAPIPADAAGLGRLTVQSALGQPLQAEVEVTSLSREEAGSPSVTIKAVLKQFCLASLLAAGIAILRELNTLAIGPLFGVSNSKMFLSDLPALLFFLFFLLKFR